MNKPTACTILGVRPDIRPDELKKRYHALMMLTHPDSPEEHEYPYAVHEINVAYEYLIKHMGEEAGLNESGESSRIRWNAPENPNAYAPRNIYQYVDDADGNRIGTVTVDTGRFMWIPDEEFPLFLKSLYACAKQIIADDDEDKHTDRSDDTDLLADITYLIAGQFFGADMALSLMKKESSADVYYCKAMLELAAGVKFPATGAALIPSQVRDHRLYMSDGGGHELGYITFKDDRLLFGLVPLFEQRKVQVKATVSETRRSVDIDLYLKRTDTDASSAIDSVNLRIAERLRD
ncbi:MAG: J domain-containing protein [Lachnospiraceae bacterium]|nr:J domain-containing protein [Lachnospiraceae bacterium]